MAFYIRDRRLTFDMSVIDTCASRWLLLVRRGRCGLEAERCLGERADGARPGMAEICRFTTGRIRQNGESFC